LLNPQPEEHVMRSKKAPRPKTAKPSTRGRRIGVTSAIGPKATTAIVIVVLAGGIWLGSRQRLSAKTTTAPAGDVQPGIGPDPSAAPMKAPVAKAHDAGAPAASTGTSVDAKPAKVPPTTLEGCLERSGDAFRLKDTSGADAPKSRSWKSGFLKKGPAAVDVVDPADSLGLANRVGTRVSVTGTLVDREMQARAIHRVASSCS
jgi:hypothetical protein